MASSSDTQLLVLLYEVTTTAAVHDVYLYMQQHTLLQCRMQHTACSSNITWHVHVHTYSSTHLFPSFKEKISTKKNTATHAEPFCSCDTQGHSDSAHEHQSHFTALDRANRRKQNPKMQRLITGQHGEPL